MARELYMAIGGVVATVSVDDGDYAPASATFDVYDAFTGGTQVTDLQTPAGSTATQVVVPSDTIPAFKGPDTVKASLFLQDAANPSAQRVPAYPVSIATTAGTGTGAVSSVAGKTGAVVLVAADVSDAGTAGQAILQATTQSAAQDAAGATATGKSLLTAASTSAARTAVGATATGSSLIIATDAAAARTAVGATATGSSAITAATADALATAAGGTTTGKALLTTASAVAARTTLSAPSQTETDLKIKAIVGGTAFGIGKGPIANRPAPGTAGLNDGDIWIETAP